MALNSELCGPTGENLSGSDISQFLCEYKLNILRDTHEIEYSFIGYLSINRHLHSIEHNIIYIYFILYGFDILFNITRF